MIIMMMIFLKKSRAIIINNDHDGDMIRISLKTRMMGEFENL